MNSKTQKQVFVLLGALALAMLIAPLYGVVCMQEYADQFFLGVNWINVLTQVLFIWFTIDALRATDNDVKPWVTVVMIIVGAQVFYIMSLTMAQDNQQAMGVLVDIFSRLVAILTGWAMYRSNGLVIKSVVAVVGVVVGLMIGMV